MDIDLINSLIKNFFIIIFSVFIIMKILNFNKITAKTAISTVLFSLLTTVLYVGIKNYTNSILALVILTILLTYFSKKITDNKMSLPAITVLISLAICFVAFGISVITNFAICNALNINNNFLQLFSIISLQAIIIYGFFKFKRYRKGFYFLRNNTKDYIDIIMINISTIIIFVYSLSGKYSGNDLTKHIFITLMTLGIIMIIIIQKTLVLHYKQNLLNQTIEDYKKEIKEKDETIQKLSNEKFNISKLNHEFYNRQKALELKVKEMTLEVGEEIRVLDRINNLTKEYSDDLQKIKGKPKLPLTNISEIDDMFKYMQTECYNNNIDFKLQTQGNIYHLVNNVIPKNKLEILIGDHIKDAIIAINSSDNKYKSILAILGIKEDCYEFCVYDTGSEFEIETLLKLGLERTTTHKEAGRKRNRFYDYIRNTKRM